jgi:lipoprotein LprA
MARLDAWTTRGRGLLGVLLALLFVAPPLAAPAPSAAADDEAVALLDRAAATMAGLESFHFTLTTPRGQTLFMENLELAALEGDVQRPDRFRATATARAAIVEVEVQVIGIGTRLWVSDPMAGGESYIEIDLAEEGGPEAALTDLLNPDRLLLEAVGLIEEPAIVGEEEIDGVETTLVEGVFDPSRLSEVATPVPPGLLTGEPLLVGIWIDEEGRVRRMELDGPLTEAEERNVTRRLDLSAFNEPVEIEPPV